MHQDEAIVESPVGEARQINRRTIAKGVAWTVPAVIVATAAPAAAVSRVEETTVTATLSAGTWTFTFTLRNSRQQAITVNILTLTKNGTTVATPNGMTSQVIASGATFTWTFTKANGNGTADAKNKDVFILNYEVVGLGQDSVTWTL